MLNWIPLILVSFFMALVSEAGHSHLPEDGVYQITEVGQAKLSAKKSHCESESASHSQSLGHGSHFCQFFSSCENLPATGLTILEKITLRPFLKPSPTQITYGDPPFDPPDSILAVIAS